MSRLVYPPPFGAPPKNWGLKTFASSHLYGWCSTVCQYPIISRCRLPPKTWVIPFLPLVVLGVETYLFQMVPPLCRRFQTPVFFLVIFNCHECFGLAIWRLSVLFIFLFIQFQFSMSCSIMLHYERLVSSFLKPWW